MTFIQINYLLVCLFRLFIIKISFGGFCSKVSLHLDLVAWEPMMMVYTIFVQDVCTWKISKRQRSSLRFCCRIGLGSIARGRTLLFGFFLANELCAIAMGLYTSYFCRFVHGVQEYLLLDAKLSSSSWRGSLRLRLGSFALTGLRFRRLRFVALYSKRYEAAAINQSVFVD